MQRELSIPAHPMAAIQDNDRFYNALHRLVCSVFRISYRRFTVLGRENIPTDGAVIYAPNHTNALCDALAVLSIDETPKVFVARADIFRNPRTASILRRLKMMPIRRSRDGWDEVRRNDETIHRAVATLRDGIPFVIMPEATHRPMHSLLPLSKGVFRIALNANEAFGKEKPVYIVPVGLEYGDFFHLWDTLTVNIGQAINVTAFAASHPEMDRPQLMLSLRETLTERMRSLILWVPDDADYEKRLRALRANPPEPFRSLAPKRMSAAGRWVFLVLGAPLFAVSAVVTLPIWLSAWLICRRVEDRAFHNSLRFVVQLTWYLLSFFTLLPFQTFVQEYLYRVKELRS